LLRARRNCDSLGESSELQGLNSDPSSEQARMTAQ
jgi:hypothetical protein